jgi:hypothetical protein
MANRKLKGQSSLETLVIFVVTVLLFGGIFNIWIWGNKQIVQRQKNYNNSRVEAGTSTIDYELKWPLQRAEELKEDKVLLRP